MAKQVLETRMVGYAPDLRHPLAPPEVVYECSEVARPKRRLTLYERCFALAVMAIWAFTILRAVIYWTTGSDITG